MAKISKKKKFFDVDIPIINKQTQLYAFDIKELEGRDIKYDLTRILRGKNILLRSKVLIKDDNATSIPVELEIMSSFLGKVVRKGTDYIEDSFSDTIPDIVVQNENVSIVHEARAGKINEEDLFYLFCLDCDSTLVVHCLCANLRWRGNPYH